MTSYSFSSGVASSTTETSGTLTLPSEYTVGTSSSFIPTLTVQYSAGDVAKTNLGNNSNPPIQIRANSCTNPPTFSKTAVDYPYYLSTTTSDIKSFTDNDKFEQKSTYLLDSSEYGGVNCTYGSNCYVWMFIRKDSDEQPDKTIQTYSTIADDWGTLLGGTEKMGTISFNKANKVSDTFYAYRTTNKAQQGATFKLRLI